jgi:hypothetical protein
VVPSEEDVDVGIARHVWMGCHRCIVMCQTKTWFKVSSVVYLGRAFAVLSYFSLPFFPPAREAALVVILDGLDVSGKAAGRMVLPCRRTGRG